MEDQEQHQSISSGHDLLLSEVNLQQYLMPSAKASLIAGCLRESRDLMTKEMVVSLTGE